MPTVPRASLLAWLPLVCLQLVLSHLPLDQIACRVTPCDKAMHDSLVRMSSLGSEFRCDRRGPGRLRGACFGQSRRLRQ